MRTYKGHRADEIPTSYTVIDIETTGLDPEFNEIIEFAALKVKDYTVTDSFNSLVKPTEEIDEFITQLTGITNEMLSAAPPVTEVLNNFMNFVGNDVVVGHNVNFDINFIYDTSIEYLDKPFPNDYLDTLMYCRRIFTEAPSHKLSKMVDYLNLDHHSSHRALDDCQATNDLFIKIIEVSKDNPEVLRPYLPKKKHNLNANEITTDNTEFNEDHPLFGKTIVFTGVLGRMPRKDAMQIVVDLGGIVGNGVTKKTNFLVLGNNEYCSSIKDGKSNKQKKAESLKLAGNDIEIISENVFYDMIVE